MIHPDDFADTLIKRLKARRAQHVESILKCQPERSYQQLCGKVAEIDQLLEEIKVVRKLEVADDDEDDALTKPMRQEK